MSKKVLGAPEIPYFRAAKMTETVRDFAKVTLKRCTNHKVNRFQLFDITPEVSVKVLEEVRDKSGSQNIVTYGRTLLPTLVDWGKYSVFRATNAERSKDTEWYEIGVVAAKRSALYKGPDHYRDWAMFSTAGKHVPNDYHIDLRDTDTADIEHMAVLGSILALNVMRRILDRPNEYRMSHGERTPRERAMKHPAVVTISLSKPVVHCVGASGLGGGWRMPEHDVRGHTRKLKSGRVVWVSGHKRGDSSVPRKTTYRVIP